MDIAIIGAGPVGCYASYLLAKSGHKVSIYEKKSQVGLPIQCTGLLTADFEKFNLPLDSFLVNTFSHLEINSPAKRTVIKQKEYLVCRESFDNYMMNLAQSEGAKICFNHSFLRKENGLEKKRGKRLEKKSVLFIKTKSGEFSIRPDLVIAADGPLSPTANAYGFYHPLRKNYLGIQAIVRGNFNAQEYKTFFGRKTCPGLFAWIVPESSTRARVGLASIKNARTYFDEFIKKNNFQVIELQSGIIPLYHPKQKLKKSNCYLLGDAAGFVKATTLGGIIPGMKQARILVDCLNHNRDYAQGVRQLKRELWLHLQLRGILNRFSDRDYGLLLSFVDQPKIKKVFDTHTRDNLIPLLAKTIIREPRFLYFVKHIF